MLWYARREPLWVVCPSEATPSSDIDVLLYGGDSFRHLNLFAVAGDLFEATGKRVDAYELSELDDGPFRDAALSEAVAL